MCSFSLWVEPTKMVVVCGPCYVCKGQSHDVNSHERKTRKGNGHLVKNGCRTFDHIN